MQDVARRGPPRRLPRDHENLPRLIDHADARCRARDGFVGAGVVDDEDFVWRSGLGKQRKETGRQQAGFVVGADDVTFPLRSNASLRHVSLTHI
jgi:hypothetical protein